MLKAFNVKHASTGDYESFETVLVYHETAEGARRLGGPRLSSGASFSETEAERAPEHDERCVEWKRPRVEDSDEYLRERGWRLEDEMTCSACGLAPFGIEKYGICRECQSCKECGCETHYDGTPCKQSEGFACG